MRILPDDDTLNELFDSPAFTFAEIASVYGTHLSAVAQHYQRLHPGQPRRARYHSLIPWVVAREHNHRSAVNHLRALARLENGLPVVEKARRQAVNWRAALISNGAVVYYDRANGFTYPMRDFEDRHPFVRPPR